MNFSKIFQLILKKIINQTANQKLIYKSSFKFNEIIFDLIRDNIVTMDEIDFFMEYFKKDYALTKKPIDLIFNYINLNKITLLNKLCTDRKIFDTLRSLLSEDLTIPHDKQNLFFKLLSDSFFSFSCEEIYCRKSTKIEQARLLAKEIISYWVAIGDNNFARTALSGTCLHWGDQSFITTIQEYCKKNNIISPYEENITNIFILLDEIKKMLFYSQSYNGKLDNDKELINVFKKI